MFLSLLSTNPLYLIPWVLAVLLSIGWHEFFHAMAGHLQGDDTAERSGRLTLNPLAHIDWIGFALMMFVGFGWGKPTPFNPYNLRFKKWGSALVALAGPLSNMLMAVLAIAAYKLLGYPNPLYHEANLLGVFLQFMLQLNLVLGLFNLLPIPPLDGSKVLYTLLGSKHQNTIIWLERNGTWLLLAFIIFAQGLLSGLVSYVLFFIYGLFGYI